MNSRKGITAMHNVKPLSSKDELMVASESVLQLPAHTSIQPDIIHFKCQMKTENMPLKWHMDMFNNLQITNLKEWIIKVKEEIMKGTDYNATLK